MDKHITTVKNITLTGHNGSGKTSLTEALLYKAGASDRLGKIAEGNTVSDFDTEEIRRKTSINTTLANFTYDNIKVNLIDTPGLLDFEGGVREGIAAAGTVLITVSGKSGVKTGTRKAYSIAGSQNKARVFVVTKLDDPNANFYNTLTELKTVFGPTVCPVIVPVIEDGQIVSYINLIEMKAYKYDKDGNASEIDMPNGDIAHNDKMDYRLDGLIQAISEAVAETDDELMEKFFDGEQFTQKELIDGIHKGVNSGKITPVLCASAATLAGIDMLLKEISLLLPSPEEMPVAQAFTANDDIVEVPYDSQAPVSAFVFKTVVDPFVGKMSYIKVMSGTLRTGRELVNAATGSTEKTGKLYTMNGKKQTEVSEAAAGDVVAASKMNISTSDTLCDSSRVVRFPQIEYPEPCFSMAVKAKTQGDESKISAAVAKLLEEDPTLRFEQDVTTNEQLLSGLGEQHLDIAVAKLRGKLGAEVVLSVPKVAYKETIRKKVKAEGKHKKQSGGHGQYGHVWIEFEPTVGDELVFEEKVFGGSVPKNFFPAVEKGIQESMKKGVLAGCPVVGLKAVLLDGSYHPVDSSEMAFKTAASIAYKEGMKQADPVMLEPIGNLSVIVNDDNTGDILGELNKRRGRMLGMNPAGEGITEILADVPVREMHDFATFLRQATKGMGSFHYEFVRYEQLPANLLSDVIVSISNSGE
ncbi:MAG: elongation factor G [Oscillospiraceae bacterium]|nr:elongation factor G [Oscillospiraceae bacterium]